MSVPISKIDKFKLETTFGEDYVVNTTYDWNLSTVRKRQSTWKQERLLGRGAFGRVWLEKEQGGELRAVKELRRNSVVTMGFAQELLSLIALADVSDLPLDLQSLSLGDILQLANGKQTDIQHKHLFVEFFGWYENESSVFFAMEYIEHGDLNEYIKADAVRARENAKEITKQVLEGVQVLHSGGICHRDLKPQASLLDS